MVDLKFNLDPNLFVNFNSDIPDIGERDTPLSVGMYIPYEASNVLCLLSLVCTPTKSRSVNISSGIPDLVKSIIPLEAFMPSSLFKSLNL